MCILIFAMGTIFGSFLTLAVYRIPLKKDITHERSFCPNCKHRLEFLDLIPVFSYIFLKGRCRYCNEKIRIRYFLLEILSGFVFLTLYLSMNFSFPFFEIDKMVYFVVLVFFYVTIALISGIDKEYRKINKSVIVFGIFIQVLYIVYLCIVKDFAIYRYSIYLGFLIFILLFDFWVNKIDNKSNYMLELVIYSLYILLFVEPVLFLIIILVTFLLSFWNFIIKKVTSNANLLSLDVKQNDNDKIRIGFYMGISTIIVVIIQNFTMYWRG